MIYLLIGYMFLFVHRPFEVWPWLGTYRIERVYMLFCLAYWLLMFPGKHWVRNKLNLAFLFFWMVLLFSWLTSDYQTAMAQHTVEEYFKVAVFYVLAMATVRDEAQLRTLIKGYLCVVGIYMTHSLREYMCGRHVYRMGVARMIGVDEACNDPNSFAATILYSLPIALPFWPEYARRRERWLLIYYIGLTILCILLTGSRSGFVGLIAFGLCSAPKLILRKKLLFVLILGAVPVIWMMLPADLQNRFRTIIDPSAGPANAQASAEGRMQGLLDGIKLWERNPVAGVGPGVFGLATGSGFQAHNLYGQTLGELGTLGALALAGIVVAFVANGLQIRHHGRAVTSTRGRFPVRLSNSILMSILLLLFKGYSDHNLYRYTWLWFGAFQAIALQVMRARHEEEEDILDADSEGVGPEDEEHTFESNEDKVARDEGREIWTIA